MEENDYQEPENTKEDEVKKIPFQSPLPAVLRLRNLVFGKEKLDIYTQVTFFLNLFIWFIFMIWSLISYFAIKSRETILENKGISIEEIIEKRGKELGFESGEFLDRLVTSHSIAIFCWALVFVGLIFLYRKKRAFIYMAIFPIVFYIGMHVFYINYRYFIEDTTTFDKVALLIALASLTLSHFLMRYERIHGKLSFFGETDINPEQASQGM